jgi:hypothetical protein
MTIKKTGSYFIGANTHGKKGKEQGKY